MAWLWDSWEEYVAAVHPAVCDSPGRWRLSHQDSSFISQCNLWDAARELEEAAQSLRQLGFRRNDPKRAPRDTSTLQTAERIVLKAIHSGETLLLYNKRLALSDASYDFLHQNHLLEQWDRYAKSERIYIEIGQLLSDIDKLLKAYQDLVEVDRRFLIGSLDLPPSLEADFQLARNLFSCGFDEAGVFMAGRGLEGVLRKIAAQRKILLEIKGKSSPASEADFRDLIEVMFHIRWKAKGTPLITPATKSLLHFLRTIRNSGAHPSSQGPQSIGNPREMAILIAENANRLWNQVATTRSKLSPVLVQKSW